MDLRPGPASLFISCGQATDTEKALAHEVAQRLEKTGFKPSVAIEVHDLNGLANNIYAQLDASEYFLLIDFKREYLLDERKSSPDPTAPRVYRGSLFTNRVENAFALDSRLLEDDGVEAKVRGDRQSHEQSTVDPLLLNTSDDYWPVLILRCGYLDCQDGVRCVL